MPCAPPCLVATSSNMLNSLFHRLWATRATEAPPAAGHVLVCPPATPRFGVLAWWARALREAAAGRAPGEWVGASANEPALPATQREFTEALAGLAAGDAAAMRERIRRARSMRELWHLRVDVFSLVALHRSQAEADDRLAWLNRRFPTRGPRSGFAELTPRDGP
jgi:hypothetical protein